MSEKALQPVLTDIVNMQLSKRDLIELLETEAEVELNNSLEIANDNLTKAIEKKDKIIQKYVEFERDQDEKLCKGLKQEILDKAKKFNINIADEHVKIKYLVTWEEIKQITVRDSNEREIYIAVTDYREYLRDIEEGTLKTKIKLYYKADEIEITIYSKEKKIKAPISYISQRAKLIDKIVAAQNEYLEQEKLVSEINKEICNIPKKIKVLSAGITRSALNSSDRGKSIIRLLDSLKRENKRVLAKK